MRILGFDFTSAPTRKKPITCAACTLQNNLLRLDDCLNIDNFADFEVLLHEQGPWVAALDFPFGLPGKLLAILDWPRRWADYVQLVSSLGKLAFEKALSCYCRARTPGDKLHLRETDRYAGARSPMMLYRVPVAKMFFQGAPRLLASGASILPCHPRSDNRILVEGYPALVARTFIGSCAYKSDEGYKQTPEKEAARQTMLDGLLAPKLAATYNLTLKLSACQVQRLIAEPRGDDLDALLCAIQAGWAYTQRHNNFGIPLDCDKNEGWIVDPAMFTDKG